MLESVTLVCHEVAPEVVFGGKRIVRFAAQRQVCFGVSSTTSEGFNVVKLEPVRFVATLAASIDVAAAAAVALEYRAAHGGWHVAPSLAGRAGFLLTSESFRVGYRRRRASDWRLR
jgi:hypothetical protein